ncbi:NEQ293 [Nanoarchaeum equitans Kin4-M]|uniref:Probable tRNA pseudouridine synthase D n=1 Tax=Nanoarchaeum equitans (strain Kin4-M) TaxID=228908 RepID=TRUD_NANEQ|nr:RecName: Full=Probable tRNA pseudouridine synthase D; AltName: Full=tRNA pseudouridine(13) synthase; AltName: Full=tRNA pseudouridylate synthase D; AltName: Full=tRNA-uridine isomerase D [Nanoarchaeum equitans Kin4-M]AAR39141.1 NEQ293 [Nanoarchaeum equitans Kin4-M]
MRIKEKPEDFVVIEKTNFSIAEPSKYYDQFKFMGIKDNGIPGDYTIYVLKKKNLSTTQAIKIIAKQFRLSKYRISFSGEKDKKAITYQLISIYKGPKKSMFLDNLELYYIGLSDKPVKLGSHLGNYFEIKVYAESPKGFDVFPNYFDVQRFGDKRLVNHLIGKHLIKNECEEAAKILLTFVGKESKKTIKVRQLIKEYWNNIEKLKKVIPLMPKALDIEKAYLQSFIEKKDYCKAFKAIPKWILMLFIHSYQSYIFNETLKMYLKNKTKIIKIRDLLEFYFADYYENIEIPLIGYKVNAKGEIKEIIDYLLDKEGITIEMLKNKKVVGTYRKGFQKMYDLKIKKNQKWLTKFYLEKGSYATVAIRSLFLEPIDF